MFWNNYRFIPMFMYNKIKQKDQIQKELEIPIKQESFLEELEKFRSLANQIENQITSYSSLQEDIENMKKYQKILTHFKKQISFRKREIHKMVRRFKSFQKKDVMIPVEKNHLHHYY